MRSGESGRTLRWHRRLLNASAQFEQGNKLVRIAGFSLSKSGQFGPMADGLYRLMTKYRVGGTGLDSVPVRHSMCSPRRGEVSSMKRMERVRQVVSGPVAEAVLKEQAGKGWKLVALEWEREVETAEEPLPVEVPFGLRIAAETQRLEEDPTERETLVQMMELIVREGSYSRIADELNRRGLRTREGARWTPISIFEMLPRLIEVGPHLFRSSEWERRKQQAVAR